jgi:hypothetical protein
MRKYVILILFSLSFSSIVQAQFTKYVVSLKDKAGTLYSISRPSEFLSQRSIERRVRQGIPVDESDLPLSKVYLDSIRSAGNVVVLDQSKWLNQVCIETSDSVALQKINNFSFVKNTKPVKREIQSHFQERKKWNEKINIITSPLSPPQPGAPYLYGNSFGQIHIHNGESLHDKGFHGEGMLIALIDAGFYHFKTLRAFDSVRSNHQIIETYDFVENEQSVDEDHVHGMMCFSIIAGNIPGALVGSAPKADFLLYRSEDTNSEMPVEEQYWAAAAERADSAGADVISTSLGYNTFDNPVFDHTYADLNGHTTIAAKAAVFAAKKGMIVLAAAGNEGNSNWHFITTPGDADSILTVGAVDVSGEVASFSSYGPSADERVKPTVASVGVATALFSSTGEIAGGNGTSFATPNLAGLVTCLWQAFPDFKNWEIIDAVKKSSSIYNAPNDRIGYGIPDFFKAFESLTQQRILRNADVILQGDRIKVYPNPFNQKFTVLIKPEHTTTGNFRLFDAAGKLYVEKKIALQKEIIQVLYFENLPSLQRGLYILKFTDGISKKSLKIIVQ